jgi:hypothetical protein
MAQRAGRWQPLSQRRPGAEASLTVQVEAKGDALMRYLSGLFIAAVAVASIPLGMAIWPPAAGSPPANVLPFFIIVGLFEGAGLGAGILWLAFGRRLLAAGHTSPALRSAARLSIGWLLVNWWAHDGLHRSGFGQTFTGVAVIDMVFHTTLIAATVIVAADLVAGARRAGRTQPDTDRRGVARGAAAEL